MSSERQTQNNKSSIAVASAATIVAGVGAVSAYHISQQQPAKVDETKNVLQPETSFVDSQSTQLELKSSNWDKSNVTVVFVLGGPGAGKGTQCSNIVRDFGFIHLSAGDLLRAERARPGSKYGELIESYIREGLIVPYEITISLLDQAMRESGGKKFLIDGFPRKMDQAQKFEEIICPSSLVLYFDCSEDTMLKRLLKRGETSGRTDDNIESIKKRFRTFKETSMPVIEHYNKIGKVSTVNCEESVEMVYGKVKTVFEKLKTQK